MISSIISRLVILVFGTLYPAYASYKAVRTKNLKEYVKWMMYWIVFALFTCTETFTDVFLSWFPFYYEVKIVLVLWLLSPATKGSSILYRKFVHPALCRREQEIDEYIAKAKDQGYHTVLNLGTKGVNYATTVIMQTAIKNFNLPSPEQLDVRARQAIRSRDVTDGYHDTYEDLEYQRNEDNLPGIVEIVELDGERHEDPQIGEGDANDPDYEPDYTSARSRGNVVRKKKVVKEKQPRSRSRGRKTRSQAAIEKGNNEILGGGGLVQQLRKSYSLSDLTECEPREERGGDEADDVLTEPRMLRRGAKTGYSTRRSASESNSRSPMYFPEVDVDVRPRPNRADEPDFSHIKSTEDISSGYSSADNSASLTRTASLGAAARARSRTSRTTVTTIKRPQAAEESEVIIEELHDDDNIEFANMPSLVQVHSPVYLSHSDPPFLYQYVGDQVKIIQVLGQYPLSNSNYSNANLSDIRNQKESAKEASVMKSLAKEHSFLDISMNEPEDTIMKENIKINNSANNYDPTAKAEKVTEESTNVKQVNSNEIEDPDHTCSELTEASNTMEKDTEKETGSLDGYDPESDDDVSFGTPENSPREKRKSSKGKYGKAKAPAPPKTDNNDTSNDYLKSNVTESISNQECSDKNITSSLDKESESTQALQLDNLVEKKQRQKSKSPVRLPISNNSSIAKLLQLPNKFAFWHRSDEKAKSDKVSTSSGEHSRRSSSADIVIDEFQSCNDLNADAANKQTDAIDIPQIKVTEDKTGSKDCASANAAQDILDKSDALKKLIEAKLETRPEYKYISLHDDLPSSSKSTDV
ncbi:hypothetical protein K1T71_001170 [Dendrolimus kikuchii]|uniref:Uncharacterized protein n=1 Tax=Dendrolimus kikuchii TaxID=765133 RepID=A0ACC1DGV4_9NEOP|nr:hypothetical protein K1T71_001170 [Dendrolimus kikuchii]